MQGEGGGKRRGGYIVTSAACNYRICINNDYRYRYAECRNGFSSTGFSRVVVIGGGMEEMVGQTMTMNEKKKKKGKK